MRAMVLDAPGQPLSARELPEPVPGPGEVLVDVAACAVCRTDLHIVDGEFPDPKLPLVLGHQVVGTVLRTGEDVVEVHPGDSVGVPWLGRTCGACDYCTTGRENLCADARFTGYQLDGGFAERMVADAGSCLALPSGFEAVSAAPFLCAGAIGYRALRLAGTAHRVGLYGFGNSARLVTQILVDQGRETYAFTRPGDAQTQELALERGCAWAGDSTEAPPVPLDGAIVFAALGELVPLALAAVAPGGSVVCAEIRMSDIPSFGYERLWGERVLRSVANLTRSDGAELLDLAAHIPLRADVEVFPLHDANEALAHARSGADTTAVLIPGSGSA